MKEKEMVAEDVFDTNKRVRIPTMVSMPSRCTKICVTKIIQMIERDLKPKIISETIDLAIVLGMNGTKHKLGMGVKIDKQTEDLTEELYKPARKHFNDLGS
ncbi:hypothetical protein CHS0354_039303 [Potamilus streckersoni]|uniref:Uncharacterized protein n=1 Tax=Potamilus streckersoni TaxID=2493646 RepID=A0AAE0T1F3_9BIVA|nr:hypothetical protein CHS0354_039303 [Potamilus streckersoni]